MDKMNEMSMSTVEKIREMYEKGINPSTGQKCIASWGRDGEQIFSIFYIEWLEMRVVLYKELVDAMKELDRLIFIVEDRSKFPDPHGVVKEWEYEINQVKIKIDMLERRLKE